MQKKSYLITGGYGMIGSTIANKLQGDIVIFSRSENHKERIIRPVQSIVKNLTEITSEDVRSADIIYHFASTVDNYNILSDPHVDVSTNITGTIKLLEAVKNLSKKPKIIFLSTFFIYGNWYDKMHLPINEDTPTDPLALYPATKLCAENIIKIYGRLYDIPYLICRLTNVYGEQEEFTNKKKGALNFMIMQAVKGEALSVYKGGDFYRDYIHVDDVVSALQFLEPRAENETFLIGYGKPVLFDEIISEILSLTGNRSTTYTVEPPAFHQVVGITNFVADTTKINTLGWKAIIDYKIGMKRIVDHYISLAG